MPTFPSTVTGRRPGRAGLPPPSASARINVWIIESAPESSALRNREGLQFSLTQESSASKIRAMKHGRLLYLLLALLTTGGCRNVRQEIAAPAAPVQPEAAYPIT